MPRFQFRLAKLRRLRVIARDERRGRLAEAYRAQQILADQQQAVGTELADSRSALREMITAGQLNVDRVAESQRYQLALESQCMTMASQAQKLEVEIEKRRFEMIEADRQVRLLDRLEARRRSEYDRGQLAAEMKQLDEVASRQHTSAGRGRGAAGGPAGGLA